MLSGSIAAAATMSYSQALAPALRVEDKEFFFDTHREISHWLDLLFAPNARRHLFASKRQSSRQGQPFVRAVHK